MIYYEIISNLAVVCISILVMVGWACRPAGFQMIISSHPSPQEALHIMAHSSHGSLAAAAKAFAQTLRPGPDGWVMAAEKATHFRRNEMRWALAKTPGWRFYGIIPSGKLR